MGIKAAIYNGKKNSLLGELELEQNRKLRELIGMDVYRPIF